MKTTGKKNSNAASDTPNIFIFYSSKTEPQLLQQYHDSLQYLNEANLGVEIVDVEEDPEAARKHDVIATPTVIVQRENDTERHIGVMTGLKPILEEDVYGKSVLHQLGFKEGRRLARKELERVDNTTIEQTLRHHLKKRGMKEFELEEFDPENNRAVGCISPDFSHDKSDWHEELEQFLGGFFTEVFGTGVMGAETACAKQGHDHCTFTIKKENSH